MNHDNDFAAVNYYVSSHRIYALTSGKHLEQHWYQFVPKALQSTAYFVIDDNFAVRRKQLNESLSRVIVVGASTIIYL